MADIHDRVVAALGRVQDPRAALILLVHMLHPDALLEPIERSTLADVAQDPAPRPPAKPLPRDVDVLVEGLIRLFPELPPAASGQQILAAVIAKLTEGQAP